MASASKIKDSLKKQLELKGANVEHFLGLIDDYIFYFNQEKAMQNDVKRDGRMVKGLSASGHEMKKENPAVKNAVIYNKQKLAILKQLELTTDNVGCGDDEEDEL
ncbi:P27 family phage terminase small subunit [Clostridium ihumii]|uniref:P27 family phage terminase small subunit n=1 Tax=Clostridium ihumii TaxID=1470356 RepID=UPI00058DB8FB|nr:P27 family phage terminase small subunit [Clostridium ihumii]